MNDILGQLQQDDFIPKIKIKTDALVERTKNMLSICPKSIAHMIIDVNASDILYEIDSSTAFQLIVHRSRAVIGIYKDPKKLYFQHENNNEKITIYSHGLPSEVSFIPVGHNVTTKLSGLDMDDYIPVLQGGKTIGL